MKARAIIAEDEPLLAASLRAELAALWPELDIAAMVGDGESARREALALRPDIVFLDIRMPGLDGLQAAAALAEDWPDEAAPFPLLVFVTAYDQHALEAFERAAVDYVLKPVSPARLAVTCARLRAGLALRAGSAGGAVDVASDGRSGEPNRGAADGGGGSAPMAGDIGASDIDAIVGRLRSLLLQTDASGAPRAVAEPLRVLQVGVGDTIRMVPIGDVLCLEAADKYLRVLTATREHLVRVALRELLPRLDTSVFWQVHRGAVVRADAIEAAHRDESGRITLTLRGRSDKIAVSRLHAHRFKAM